MGTTPQEYLFTFERGRVLYNIFRLNDGRYRFASTNGNAYIVHSWKDEIRYITGGVVNYR